MVLLSKLEEGHPAKCLAGPQQRLQQLRLGSDDPLQSELFRGRPLGLAVALATILNGLTFGFAFGFALGKASETAFAIASAFLRRSLYSSADKTPRALSVAVGSDDAGTRGSRGWAPRRFAPDARACSSAHPHTPGVKLCDGS